jgi:hypothetical protein
LLMTTSNNRPSAISSSAQVCTLSSEARSSAMSSMLPPPLELERIGVMAFSGLARSRAVRRIGQVLDTRIAS